MITEFANMTELRTQVPSLEKRAKKNGYIVLLKNGKPTLGLIDYAELLVFEQWKTAQKKEQVKNALRRILERSKEQEIGEKWLQKKGFSQKDLSEEEIINMIALETKHEKHSS